MKFLSKARVRTVNLPKGIYHWNLTGKKRTYKKYRACIKVNGKVKTIGYFTNLSEACKHYIDFHKETYGEKPFWYPEYLRTYQYDTQEIPCD